MEGHIEREAVQEGMVPLEEPGKKDQMGRTADRQKFRQALQDTQKKGLKGRGGQVHDLVLFSPRWLNGDDRNYHLPGILSATIHYTYHQVRRIKSQGLFDFWLLLEHEELIK
jgi:hypothetical protein